MGDALIDSFVVKAEAYFSTANSDAVAHHDLKVNELIQAGLLLKSDFISLYHTSQLKDTHKLVLLHLLDRMEYRGKPSRKDIPYSVSELKTVFINALMHSDEAMRFQAVKSSNIAESIAREDKTFGDYYFNRLQELLKDNSARIRTHVLFLMCCNAPDSKVRELSNKDVLKRILINGTEKEKFQALQYLRGKKDVVVELKPALSNMLNVYSGKDALPFSEIFVKYLKEEEIIGFVKHAIKLNTLNSIAAVLSILSQNKYGQIKELAAKNFDEWYANFPDVRTKITEIAAQFSIPLKSLEGDGINNLPEEEFLAIVSNKRVEGTLPRILKIFAANAVLIYRGDGGYDIMSAVSFYSKEEVKGCTSAFISAQALNDALNYCSN